MSDAFFLFQMLAIPAALMGVGWYCSTHLPKEPRLRATALLVYMIALLGLYVGVAYLGLLSWERRDPYWVESWRPLLFDIQIAGTLALFCGIFMVPVLVGLVLWRLVALLVMLGRAQTKTPGYR